ncbi:hypothetical protein LY76DRAFT_125804 [Colletotrichum caudatum]|nr:hypothetical protein LY76DRAFT_125804 [Colletotrichum caudatum]
MLVAYASSSCFPFRSPEAALRERNHPLLRPARSIPHSTPESNWKYQESGLVSLVSRKDLHVSAMPPPSKGLTCPASVHTPATSSWHVKSCRGQCQIPQILSIRPTAVKSSLHSAQISSMLQHQRARYGEDDIHLWPNDFIRARQSLRHALVFTYTFKQQTSSLAMIDDLAKSNNRRP